MLSKKKSKRTDGFNPQVGKMDVTLSNDAYMYYVGSQGKIKY